jgi:hypothetical protein
VFPALLAMQDGESAPSAIANVISACAEGYPFPTNLDLDSPVSGLAPPAQADILSRAVAAGWPQQKLDTELTAWTARRSS